ncbi:MAG: PKD domain-containing protein [Bacteroidota bacterium]
MGFTNNSQGAVRYRWNFGNGQESALPEPSVTYEQEGSYPINLVSFTEFGCSDTATYESRVYPQATALFTATPDGGCSPLDVSFSNLSSGYNYSQWILDNNQVTDVNSPQFSYRDSGSYDVQLIVNTDGFCGDTLSIQGQVNVRPSPIPSFTYADANPNPVSRGTVLFTNTSQLADSYLWDFGDGNTSTAPNPVHTYDYNGPFVVTLVAFKNNGCIADTSLLVNPAPFHDLKIPTAFAPYDVPFDSTQYRQTYALKGSAAVFHPIGVGLQDDGYEIAIYNKWGKRIWYSTKVDEEGRPADWWDGRINGKMANLDVFVWKVHKAVFIGGTEWGGPREGTVTLIR